MSVCVWGKKGLPWWLSSKRIRLQCRRCRRHRVDPGLGRSPGEGNATHYSCLGNPMDRGAWATVSYSPWSLKELDMTKQLSMHAHT